MTRPTLEVADILRAQGDYFLDRYRSSFDFQQLKAFRAILRCRTAALGIRPSLITRAEIGTAPAPALAGGTGTRTLGHQLLPCRVHCAPRTQRAGLGKPRSVLRS